MTFNRSEVIVNRSKDSENADCGKDGLKSNSLHVAFRFRWRSGDWIPEKTFFRAARMELVQVLARSDLDSLTAELNEANQCEFGQWKTNKDHDITNANCQGSDSAVKFPWPLVAPASMDFIFLIENNQLKIMRADESMDQALLPIVSSPVPIGVSRFGFRDISVKYWNNEKPDIGKFIFSQDLPLDNLPTLEGGAYFRQKDRSGSNLGYFSIKNGVMSVRMELYNILGEPFLTMNATTFMDKKSGDLILVESSESNQFIQLSKASTILGQVEAPALPKRGSLFDLKAPELKLLLAPPSIVANEPFELKISAHDDLSGLGAIKIEARCDTILQETIPMKSMRYEGKGMYWVKFEVINTRDKTCEKVTKIIAVDRVGREASLAVDLPVQLLP
jgi:hypothetical protein